MANHTRTYGDDIRDEIIERLSQGETLRAICASREGMPDPSTVVGWCDAAPDYAQRYARASDIGWDVMAEDTIRIGDDVKADPCPNSRRLRVDTRRWLISKRNARKYGDKVAVTGDQGGPVEISVRWDTDKPTP